LTRHANSAAHDPGAIRPPSHDEPEHDHRENFCGIVGWFTDAAEPMV
jgi:hypothetical protein